jgi:hypothetical protein
MNYEWIGKTMNKLQMNYEWTMIELQVNYKSTTSKV